MTNALTLGYCNSRVGIFSNNGWVRRRVAISNKAIKVLYRKLCFSTDRLKISTVPAVSMEEAERLWLI